MNRYPQTSDSTIASPRARGRQLAWVGEAIRTRRAGRGRLAREIAAYPATRSVATVVLPARGLPVPAPGGAGRVARPAAPGISGARHDDSYATL